MKCCISNLQAVLSSLACQRFSRGAKESLNMKIIHFMCEQSWRSNAELPQATCCWSAEMLPSLSIGNCRQSQHWLNLQCSMCCRFSCKKGDLLRPFGQSVTGRQILDFSRWYRYLRVFLIPIYPKPISIFLNIYCDKDKHWMWRFRV